MMNFSLRLHFKNIQIKFQSSYFGVIDPRSFCFVFCLELPLAHSKAAFPELLISKNHEKQRFYNFRIAKSDEIISFTTEPIKLRYLSPNMTQ